MDFNSALVTGGAGFIGSNLVGKLLAKGIKVTVLDNFSTGSHKSLEPFENDIEIIEGDIRDTGLVNRAVSNSEVVFHLAAIVSVPESIENPVETTDVNITGTVNLLNASVKHAVNKFVLASSCAVYGDAHQQPIKETAPVKPMSPYAASKLSGEIYCRYFTENFDIQAVALRFFNVFGPGQNPESNYAAAIPKFITLMLNGKQPTIFGDGLQTRDFIYIDNVAEANIIAAAHNHLLHSTYNCACSKQTSLNDVIGILNEKMGKNIKPNYAAGRSGDIKHSFADTTLMEEELGFKIKIDFEKGLEKTIEYYNGL